MSWFHVGETADQIERLELVFKKKEVELSDNDKDNNSSSKY